MLRRELAGRAYSRPAFFVRPNEGYFSSSQFEPVATNGPELVRWRLQPPGEDRSERVRALLISWQKSNVFGSNGKPQQATIMLDAINVDTNTYAEVSVQWSIEAPH